MAQEDCASGVRELRDITREQGEKIAALTENAKSAHKRLNEMSEFTASVNNLAQAVALVAEKVEHITERLDKSIERIEQGQKAQGERIGSLEKAVLSIAHSERVLEEHDQRINVLEKAVLLIEQNTKRLDGHDKRFDTQDERLDVLEKAPGDKWNKLTWGSLMALVTGVIAYLVGKFL